MFSRFTSYRRSIFYYVYYYVTTSADVIFTSALTENMHEKAQNIASNSDILYCIYILFLLENSTCLILLVAAIKNAINKFVFF